MNDFYSIIRINCYFHKCVILLCYQSMYFSSNENNSLLLWFSILKMIKRMEMRKLICVLSPANHVEIVSVIKACD